jgi:2-keto-4-pentenoate hydratase/2-oxohepta-3-ene-1,7-dioic acid hydratase in catechol pathway
MRLVGVERNGQRLIGRLRDDTVEILAGVDDFYADIDSVLKAAPRELLARSAAVLVPPVPKTSRIFCVGINYRDHAAEAMTLAGIEAPKVPMIFGRWESTLVVDGTPVPIPPNEPGLDWEVELAVVIGRKTWAATPQTAMDSVLGYCAFNDLSARVKQLETRQFTLGKNADRSGPIGPALVTKDEIADVDNLRVTTRVNGKTVQDASTKDFIHDIPRLISYITDTVTLLPGDVIATGTPGGVGVSRTPPMYLQPGDIVEVEVEGIGVVRNPIVSRESLAVSEGVNP